jgi:hypothetical protein
VHVRAGRFELGDALADAIRRLGVVARDGAVLGGDLGAALQVLALLDRLEAGAEASVDPLDVAPMPALGVVADQDRLAQRDEARRGARGFDAASAFADLPLGGALQAIDAGLSALLERRHAADAGDGREASRRRVRTRASERRPLAHRERVGEDVREAPLALPRGRLVLAAREASACSRSPGFASCFQMETAGGASPWSVARTMRWPPRHGRSWRRALGYRPCTSSSSAAVETCRRSSPYWSVRALPCWWRPSPACVVEDGLRAEPEPHGAIGARRVRELQVGLHVPAALGELAERLLSRDGVGPRPHLRGGEVGRAPDGRRTLEHAVVGCSPRWIPWRIEVGRGAGRSR